MRIRNVACVLVLVVGCGGGGKGGPKAREEFAYNLDGPQGCFREVDEEKLELKATCERGAKQESFLKAVEGACPQLRELGFKSVALRAGNDARHDDWTLSLEGTSCTMVAVGKKLGLEAVFVGDGVYFNVANTDCASSVSPDKKKARVSVGGGDACKPYERTFNGESPRDLDKWGAGWIPLGVVLGKLSLAKVASGHRPDVTAVVKQGGATVTATATVEGNWKGLLNEVVKDDALRAASGIGAKGGGGSPKTAFVVLHDPLGVAAVGEPTFDTVDLLAIETENFDKHKTGSCGSYSNGKKSQSFTVRYVPSTVKLFDPRTGKTVAEQTFVPEKRETCPDSIVEGDHGVLVHPETATIVAWVQSQLKS